MKLANSIIAVTGASGFVGSALCRRFSLEGATVRMLVRHPGESPREHPFDLANHTLDPAALAGVRAMVHCAWDIKTTDLQTSRSVNVAGTHWLADQCKTAGVEQFVFVSSMASHEQAHSVYGRTKFEAEQQLLADAGLKTTVIAPGTIIGSGGVFAQTRKMVGKLPVIPIFYPLGNRKLQTVYIDDLCDVIVSAIAAGVTGRLLIADETGIALKDFYRGLAMLEKRNPLLIPFPGDLALLGVRLLEALGIKSPVTSSNLMGIKHLRHFDVRSSFAALNSVPVANYWKSLERLAMAEARMDAVEKIRAVIP